MLKPDDEAAQDLYRKLPRLPLVGHSSDRAVLNLAFTADSATVISSEERDARLWYWNVASRTIEQRREVPGLGEDGSQSMIAPACNRVVLLYPAVRVVNLDNQSVWGIFDEYLPAVGLQVPYAAISSDCGYLALGEFSGNYHDWLIKWGIPSRFVPKERPILTAADEWEHVCLLWDLPKGAAIQALRFSKSLGDHQWKGVAFSPKGKVLAHVGGHRQYFTQLRHKGIITVFDLDSGNVVRRLEAERSLVRPLVWSPDGNLLASGVATFSSSNTFLVFDVISGKPLDIFSSSNAWGWPIAFTVDGRFLLSATEKTGLAIWHVKTGEKVASIQEPFAVRCAAFSPDGKWLATAGERGTLGLWRLNLLLSETAAMDDP